MAIELTPATNPLDIPSPKPSEIVRRWPDANWWQRDDKYIAPSGHVHFCATGIIAETGGFDWGEPDYSWRNGEAGWGGEYTSDAAHWVAKTHNLTMMQVKRLMQVNDQDGKDAAADLLEGWGL